MAKKIFSGLLLGLFISYLILFVPYVVMDSYKVGSGLAYLAEQSRLDTTNEEKRIPAIYNRITDSPTKVGLQYATSFGILHLSFALTVFVFIGYCIGIKMLNTKTSVLFTIGLISLASVSAFLSQFIIGAPKNSAIGGAVGVWIISCIVYGILYGSIWGIRRLIKRKEEIRSMGIANDNTAIPKSSNFIGSWWRERSKNFRLWCFYSITWAIAVFLYVVAFDPYNNGNWRYMDEAEYLHMFFIMFMPPIFIGSAKYSYERWVK